MSADCFQTLDVTRFHRALADLHKVVASGRGRVEVTGPECDGGACVLISKTELESLERALEILSESVEFRQMSDQIAQIVAATSDPLAPVLRGEG